MEQVVLRATITNDYVNKKGNDTFVYHIHCTPAQKALIKEIKGVDYRETEDGVPLFYTVDYIGDDVNLIITTNKRLVLDKSDLRKIKSLSRQLGANVGQAMAEKGMERLMDKMFTTKKRVSADPAGSNSDPAGSGDPTENETENQHTQTLNEM